MNVTPLPVAGPALKDHDALPPGTRFGEFEILRVLGVGGFGIVYLAQDHSLERQVALKEYMPAALAARGSGPMITVRAGAFAETYAAGLRSFVNEARLLARFDHPSLVKVYRFWEDNGTAYMVMPYLQGRTLRDARRAMMQSPDEAWLRSVLDPLLDALELLHREGVYHRDIAPDNILLPPGALPILLDFGAARRVIADRTQTLTTFIKPSYAPIEQYAEMAELRQGPWTDLYALGAVLHYLLFGVPPAPATARAVQPDAQPLDQRVVAGVSPHFIGVVAWMLGVRPLERPQSVAALRTALNGQLTVPADLGYAVTMPSVTAALPPPAPRTPRPAPAVAPLGTVPLRSTPPGTLPQAYVPPPRPATAAPRAMAMDAAVAATEPAPRATASPHGRLKRIGAVAAGVAALGVLWAFVGVVGGARPGPPSAASAVATAAPTPAPAAPAKIATAEVPAASPPAATEPPPAPRAPINAGAVSGAEPVAAASAAPAVRLRARPAPKPALARTREGPSSAREACAERNFFTHAVCMDRECERPQFRASAECVRVLAIKQRRIVER